MSKEKASKKFYSLAVAVVKPIVRILYPMKITGTENIPDGAAIICANHSNYIDPVLIAIAFTSKYWIRFMAKIELFSIPVLKGILSRLGTFPVDRSNADVSSVRTAMRFLKSGEKIMIFPEGTRVSEDDAVAAKSGAVRMASKLKVPVVPIFITRKKVIFKKVELVIGAPYSITAAAGEYDSAAEDLMCRIRQLGEHSV